LKEANETEYWLMLLKDTNYISEKEFASVAKDCKEILKLLISIVKTTKTKLKVMYNCQLSIINYQLK